MIEIKEDIETYVKNLNKKIPCYIIHEEFSSWGNPGVYFINIRRIEMPDGQKFPSVCADFVCSPIVFEAISRSECNDNYGRLIRFLNVDNGLWIYICVSLRLAKNSYIDLITLLNDLGARIKTKVKNRNMFIDYIEWDIPKRKVISVTKTGWLDESFSFVLPNNVIPKGMDIYLQHGSVYDNNLKQKGTLDEWINGVAKYCGNNIIMMACLGVSFAAPLLKILNEESGGINWVGDSSKGKTTTLDVGRSIWGSVELKSTWLATSNGIEASASMCNDMCLFLDEIGQANPKNIGDIIYLLGNGKGKSRMTEDIVARPTLKWRTTLLSTGEKTISTHMKSAEIDQKMGQLARFLDIPCTSMEYGIFDYIHGFENAHKFSDFLKNQTYKYYGSASIKFINELIKIDNDKIIKRYTDIKELFFNISETSLFGRVSKKFALYALSLELAIYFKILPFEKGYGIECMKLVFELWKKGNLDNNQGDSEILCILNKVNDYICKYGDSRFDLKNKTDNNKIISNRSGWYINIDNGDRVYLFTKEGLESATKGYDFKKTKEVLKDNGWIYKCDDLKTPFTKSTKIDGKTLSLFYISPLKINE